MSSGFLAQHARQAAKKQGVQATIEARSESEVGQYLKKIDILMVGPHYANRISEFKKMAEAYQVVVIAIPQDIYASLNGAGLLELAAQELAK